MRPKRFLTIVLFVIAFTGAVVGFVRLGAWTIQKSPDIPALRKEALADFGARVGDLQKGVEAIIDAVQGKVVAPPPMRRTDAGEEGQLSRVGVIQETNDQRVQFGLPTLEENTLLNQAASLKLRDMFDKQYFEHVSPEGFGPSHWVEIAGYKYRIIGENLALGNFENDADLVDAWMNSPGHRENILREEFRDIGVAVGRGMFEGQETWLAVQTFGRPLPNCPKPNATLLARSKDLNAELDALLPRITELRRVIEEKQDRGESARKEIDEYNRLVEEYNAIVAELKQTIAAYNESVKTYNACIDG